MTDCAKPLRVLVLSSYSPMGASSRIRMYQYEQALTAFGIECTFAPLLGEQHLTRRYNGQGISPWLTLRAYWYRFRQLLQSKSFDVIWLEKELFPWVPYAIEGLLLGRQSRYVVEYDDAIFHRYDQHSSAIVRKFYARKIANLMRGARCVIAGNDYIQQYALGHQAVRSEIIPTVIDMDRYPQEKVVSRGENVFRVGWIGTPVTAPYLNSIRDALQRLGENHNVELHVIGGTVADIPGVVVRAIQWDSDLESKLIRDFDVGVMPLPNAEWERGKCGYKLIQYMGCSLPVVASPVGVNNSIVREGVTGFLANDSKAWFNALNTLANSVQLRRSMGEKGREVASNEYSLQAVVAKLAGVLREAAN